MVSHGNRNQSVLISCKLCGREQHILVNSEDLISWQAGHTYIQESMSYLSAAEREMLISGTCNDCWARLYGEDLDDEV